MQHRTLLWIPPYVIYTDPLSSLALSWLYLYVSVGFAYFLPLIHPRIPLQVSVFISFCIPIPIRGFYDTTLSLNCCSEFHIRISRQFDRCIVQKFFERNWPKRERHVRIRRQWLYSIGLSAQQKACAFLRVRCIMCFAGCEHHLRPFILCARWSSSFLKCESFVVARTVARQPSFSHLPLFSFFSPVLATQLSPLSSPPLGPSS